MAISTQTDLAIIGAGSGGLGAAAGAAQMGANVVLFERDKMGGDCLNYGCVPSKSLLAAARAAHAIRTGSRFGVNSHEPEVDFARVNGHVHEVVGTIAPHDSVERFEGLGVRVVQACARFVSPREVEAAGERFRARRFVIATGSSPAAPSIRGLASVPFLTNETIFSLSERPEHLLIIGGGPIGTEMAQAHRRLGSAVTVFDSGEILPRDDRDAVAVVRRRLIAEGVDLREHVRVSEVAPRGNGAVVRLADENGETTDVEGTHVLIATGRRANVRGLGLEEAGVEYSNQGIKIDARLRTSNKRVFAIGDAAGGYQFTHVAGYHAGVVIRNALFRLPTKADHRAVPWVTYSDPEPAHVGVRASDAHPWDRVLQWSFAENDRAQAERETEGFIKVVADRRGRVRGVTLVGPHAGELLLPWVLAVQQRMKIGAMASVIAPYPTLGEISKRAAGSYYTDTLFGQRTRRVVRFLQRLGG